MKILYTGSAGFIGNYVVRELIEHGHQVVGIDNFSKYGKINTDVFDSKDYQFIEGDAKDVRVMKELASDCDQILAGAAKIGGITYFHEFAYDLLAENERILASTFDAAIHAFQKGKLKKINVLSSSMVFEKATVFPTPEGHQKECPPPFSSYGFQKLACEYFAEAAWEQYKLPYTIIRPFNCVGIGEKKALSSKKIMSGNVEMAMSHVLPDLVQKLLKGQKPLHILGDGNQIRHYTYGADLARGIRLCIESDQVFNNDFNLSTTESTTVRQLAELIWKKIRPGEVLQIESDQAYPHDVQKRVPATHKAKQILGFEANTPLESVVEEIIPWIQEQIQRGTI
ncbi:MAG: NAD(P)-dependent oxidoreductase [Deltaproteobacteria bacterium]|nr:NAD(P)-dependent oxidoreductase [Deltaproteobacteria bacterium]